jgi:hypothetical protein
MSCDSNSNAIARLVCQASSGISQLDSKRAFYAGLALGAASAGAGAVVVAKRHCFGRAYKKLRGGNATAKTALLPTGSGGAQAIPTKSVTGQQTRPRELRPIKPIPRPEPKTIPALARAAQETKLKAEPIQMRVGSGGETFTSPNSYRVIRPDGSDTGLAITPGVTQGENGPVEQPGEWGITHTGTGGLISGPYSDLSKAQQLASQLSGLRWTESNVPKSDVMKAKNIIKAFAASGAPPLPAAPKSPASRSKFVITDKVTGDEYETFDSAEAGQFAQALGSDGESRVLEPGAPDFDQKRKAIPPGIEIG